MRTQPIHHATASTLAVITIALLFLLSPCYQTQAQTRDTIRIATYNLLNFDETTGPPRITYFNTILRTINPDILVAQDIVTEEGLHWFLYTLDHATGRKFAGARFHDGPGTDNGFLFDTTKIRLLNSHYISTGWRDIAEYRVEVKRTHDTLRIFSCNLQEGNTDEAREQRAQQTWIIRKRMDTVAAEARLENRGDTTFLLAGGLNIYYSTETAYLNLLAKIAYKGPGFFDPADVPGEWHNNAIYKRVHTQSTRIRSFDSGETGGLHDRFDFILADEHLFPHQYVPQSYTTYGNDGMHMNDSINRLPNLAVPDSVANALHYASDHLPVFVDFILKNSTLDVPYTPGEPDTMDLSGQYNGEVENRGTQDLFLWKSEGSSTKMNAR